VPSSNIANPNRTVLAVGEIKCPGKDGQAQVIETINRAWETVIAIPFLRVHRTRGNRNVFSHLWRPIDSAQWTLAGPPPALPATSKLTARPVSVLTSSRVEENYSGTDTGNGYLALLQLLITNSQSAGAT